MTTFEHAMLGIDGALAAGLHRRFGWQVAALAGLAAVSPDWDGLTLLYSLDAFAAGHRLWGHNVVACCLIGLAIGGLDYRFDLVTRCGRVLNRIFPSGIPDSQLAVRHRFSIGGLTVWMLVAITAALSQLPADLVVSGTDTLPDWELKPLWPFSQQALVFPLVPWGDVGITLIFIAGMFAMLRWRPRVQAIAIATLALVTAYIALRGAL